MKYYWGYLVKNCKDTEVENDNTPFLCIKLIFFISQDNKKYIFTMIKRNFSVRFSFFSESH